MLPDIIIAACRPTSYRVADFGQNVVLVLNTRCQILIGNLNQHVSSKYLIGDITYILLLSVYSLVPHKLVIRVVTPSYWTSQHAGRHA